MWGVSYWIFPVISGVVWCGMLIAMLVWWTAGVHQPHLASMEPTQTIAYISDIGAFTLKPLFIAGSCVTVVFLDLAFVSERWLRHRGRLAANLSVAEKVLSAFSMVFALIGTAGLILLSIFDTNNHPRLHNVFLLLFIVGYVVSAVFICAEYQRLGIHFREHRVLRASFWIKLTFILVEIVFAIVFAATTFTGRRNVAAIFEWIIAFVFTFYVLSFVIDLAPAVKTKHAAKNGKTSMELEQNDNTSVSRDRAYGGGMTGDAGLPHQQGRVVNNVAYPAGANANGSTNF